MKRLIVNKRGLEMAFSTIIVIVLAILLLVFMILALNKSSGSFMDKINSFFSKSNVDSVVDGCNTLASQNQNYEYCCTKKTVKISTGKKLEVTCLEARNNTWGSKIEELNCESVC